MESFTCTRHDRFEIYSEQCRKLCKQWRTAARRVLVCSFLGYFKATCYTFLGHVNSIISSRFDPRFWWSSPYGIRSISRRAKTWIASDRIKLKKKGESLVQRRGDYSSTFYETNGFGKACDIIHRNLSIFLNTRARILFRYIARDCK
jgi:hypothetical protein